MNEEKQIVYLNGKYLDISEAKVSVLDRGFIFGDGVYEVIPVYAGYLFRFEEHIQRLFNSLKEIRLELGNSLSQWQTIIEQLIQRNGSGDWSIYLHITRGVAKRDHGFPGKDIEPTVFIMCNPLYPQSEELREKGVKAVTLADNRWLNCHIKAISLLPNILLRQQAMDSGTQEAILIRDGFATEGAASNLFIVNNNILITPEKSQQLLPGVTRDLIVELAQNNQLEVREQAISEHELINADEIWLTSSTKEILAVTHLNDSPVANGRPGALWKKMMALYQQYKNRLRQGAKG
ncbi:MAG: D-amino acid aminotransferase [Pseudomonadota bacterium]